MHAVSGFTMTCWRCCLQNRSKTERGETV